MSGPARSVQPPRRITATTALAMVSATVVGLVMLLATGSAAHTTEQPYLYVFVSPDSIDGRAELAIGDVEQVLGAPLGDNDAEIEATLRQNREALVSYLADHLSIGDGSTTWPIEFGAVDLFREAPGELAFAVVQYAVDLGGEDIPSGLEIGFDPFFDEVPGRDGLLLLNGGFQAGEYVADQESLITYTAGDRVQSVDLGGQGFWGNIRSSITLGVDHIKTGPDHILFVLALMLPSVLVFDRRWHPISGFGSSLWRVVKIATFFTLAHSITFTMAGMGWLPTPPSKIVESIIAVSIAAAALHNVWPIFPNREWSLSFVFGLFHGMGFASLVSGLEVSRSSQLLSLLGRNIGIEIGQVAVILLLFPALYLLRRTPIYAPFFTVASVVLAALALLWTVERIFEVSLGTDDLVDQFVAVPRAYWLAAGLTLAAFAAYRYFSSSDLLIPTREAP